MKLSRYMSPAEICDMLEMKGPGRERRLRRLLATRERELGNVKLRVGVGKQTRYRITLTQLRAICPEFFDRRDEVAEELRQFLLKVEVRLDAVGAQLTELRNRDDALAAAIRRLNTVPT